MLSGCYDNVAVLATIVNGGQAILSSRWCRKETLIITPLIFAIRPNSSPPPTGPCPATINQPLSASPLAVQVIQFETAGRRTSIAHQGDVADRCVGGGGSARGSSSKLSARGDY